MINGQEQIICTETMNRGNFLRKIERFGMDVQDTCLFPLALPMDGSDIYRGHSTWESIHLLADCVLMLWTTTTTTTKSSCQSMNNVLGEPLRFLCFHPELMDRRKFPHVKSSSDGRKYDPLPFRRWCSELDLRDFPDNNKQLMETEDPEMILENFCRKSRTNCRQLAYKHELKNPKCLAARITRLEKQNFLRITRREALNYLFGKIHSNNQNLNQMIRFSQELSELVGCWIRTETSVEGRKQIMATIIEVAFILFMRNNFQSFESIMRGLRLPSVYSLQESWRSLRLNNSIHFRIYHYLTTVIINQLQQKSFIFHSHSSLATKTKSLPSLNTFFETLRLRSLPIICRLIDDNNNGGDHHIDVRNIGHESLIDIINQYYHQCKDDNIRQKLNELTINERRRRRKRNIMTKTNTGKRKKRFFQFPKILRKEKHQQNEQQLVNDENVIIAASYMSLLTKKFDKSSINDAFHGRDDDCLQSLRMYIEQQFVDIRDQPLPDRWRIISVRNIDSNVHQLLTTQFFQLYKDLLEQIEQYKF
ncbi:hypothetical protein BLA29_001547 [Euroglyphus maynei]|uniref:Ras-GEF domain-containing protein n=1 Tax=Euroglyphus maynei TaxID=6958 RepID=A0A1Y3BEE8_EURMA|nr:hypothetical protein BLA29_001547 [Euroglyphus maynei]